MSDYQQCRALGEEAIKTTGVPATFIRPWYVVGPGHYWPLFSTLVQVPRMDTLHLKKKQRLYGW